MKNIFNRLIWIIAGTCFILASCNKEETKVILIQPNTATFTGSATSVVLDSTKNDNTAVTFSWSKVNYGYNADVTYTLQFDTPSDSFKSAVNVVLPLNTLSRTYTVKDLNALAYQSLRLPANVASTVVVRLKADVNQNGVITGPSSVPSVYSNTFSMQVTPYQIIIVYPLLYLPGDYEGWNPATAPTVASVLSNNVYEGYVNFPGATTQFKFTSAPDWSHINYGDAGNGTSGNISTTGGNMLVTGPGYYLLKADLNANTWSATQTVWGMVGDATPGGWNTDTPMIYDAVNGVWVATVSLTVGSIKFRANGSWDINLGDNKPANGLLTYGGENIPVSVAGNYKITLDLSHPGNYTYQVKKL